MILYHAIYGKLQGNFRTPTDPASVALWQEAMQSHVLDTHGFERVCLMRPAFTTRIVHVGEDGWTQEMPTVFRTIEPADGIITNRVNVALGMANGDCPAAIVHDESSGILALLHCGLKCLVPPNGERGILESFFASDICAKENVVVHCVYGIGPCCYGLDTLPECGKNALVKSFPVGIATHGPRKGKQSINLFVLMREQLKHLGLKDRQILRKLMPSCTACKTRHGTVEYHSNVYDAPNDGRNLVLAWMQPRR